MSFKCDSAKYLNKKPTANERDVVDRAGICFKPAAFTKKIQ